MRRGLLIALLLTFTLVAPVAAVAPNDTAATATPIALGQTITQDTTAADETDPIETALNDFCGAPVVEHGVWFSFTATADGLVAFDVSGSSYSAGVMLFEGTPTPEGLLACGPGRVPLGVSTGVTYSALAFGDGLTDETSGTLVITVVEAVAAPTIDLVVNRSASVSKDNVVHISGTVTCTSDDGSGSVVEIFGDLTQRVGRILIRGFFDELLDIPCDGASHPWDAFAVGDNGIFSGGKAASVTIGVGCTDFCNVSFVEATLQLKRNGK